MTEKPNCSNCPHHTENKYMDFCCGYPLSNDNPTEIYNHIKKRGCLSHPGAREWLMGDVIETMGNEIQCIEDDIPEMQNLGNINKAMQTIGVLRAAISLIKNGVIK
jgi:hypothetical protein